MHCWRNRKRVEIDIRGPRTSRAYHQRTSCRARSRSQQVLNASSQTWVRSSSHWNLPLFSLTTRFSWANLHVSLWYECDWGYYGFFFFVNLDVGFSSTDAPLILWDLFHASDGRATFRGGLSHLLSPAIVLNCSRDELNPGLCIFSQNKAWIFIWEPVQNVQAAAAAAVCSELVTSLITNWNKVSVEARARCHFKICVVGNNVEFLLMTQKVFDFNSPVSLAVPHSGYSMWVTWQWSQSGPRPCHAASRAT